MPCSEVSETYLWVGFLNIIKFIDIPACAVVKNSGHSVRLSITSSVLLALPHLLFSFVEQVTDAIKEVMHEWYDECYMIQSV